MPKVTLPTPTFPLFLIVLIVVAIAFTAFKDRGASTTAGGSSIASNAARQTIVPLDDSEGVQVRYSESASAAPTHEPQPKGIVAIEGFQVSPSGQLVLGPHTRVAIENLAQTAPADLVQEITEINQQLPPVAAAQVVELATRFQVYFNALAELPPVEQGTLTSEGALLELEALHNLRVTYLGKEVADGFFGEEEALNKEVARLLGIDNDSTRTPADRISQADSLRASLPLVAALERRNMQGHLPTN